MGKGLNKVMLIGNVGADPVMRYSPEGQPVATWKLATSETKRNPDGERREVTEWHSCHCKGYKAEYVRDNVFKGNKLYCEGMIKTRTFKQNDQKISVKEIKVSDVQILGDSIKQQTRYDNNGKESTKNY